MQQFRDSFLEDDCRLAPMRGAGAGDDEAERNEDEKGNNENENENENENFDDSGLFLEEASDEVAPLLSDAERFWGASAAPEMVLAAVEDFCAGFVEGLLRGQLADVELVRRRRRRRRRRR